MKKLTLLFALLTPFIVNAGSKHMRGFWMANHLYASESSVSLPQDYKNELGQLLMDVWDGSTYQDCCAAKKAAQYLQKDVDVRLEALKNLPSNDESKKVALENSLFIIQQQQDWLHLKVQELEEKLTVKDKVFGFLYDVYATVINFFGKQDVIVVGNTATKIYDYARFEREQLFVNFQATSQWLSVQKKVGFPHLIYFWKDKKAAHLLLLRLKKCGQNIQLLSAIIDAGAEIIAGGVEGETEAIVTELTTEASEAAVAQISTITEGITDSAGDTIGKESVTDIAAETGEGALTPLKEAAGDILANPKAVNMSILDNIINGTKSVYNSMSDWYEDSVVGRAFKAIGKAYDNTIEAGYKKWIYNKFIAPLENNSLNGALKSLPHILKGPVDMLIQIEIMQGGGLIANWVSLDNQKVFNNLENQANAITDSFNSFYRSWNDAQSNEQTIYLTNFFNQINSLVQYQHVIVDTAQAQLSLISKSLLSANQNQLYYVNNPTDQSNYTFWIDQQFILSPMYNSSIPALNNPKQSYPTVSAASQNLSVLLPITLPFVGAWHNIWRVGNWEYIAEEKSFYQQTIVPLIAPAQTDKNKPSIADQALNNTVFTEYYPKSSGVVPPYTVSVDIDITQVTYPFFVGVIFNNARWISGIQDRYQQQRYAGFYGTADKTVYLIVAESLISTQDQIKAGASAMQSPFYVVTNNDISYFATAVILPNTATTSFSGKYNLSINTQPTQAAITLTSKTTATPVVTTINATNLNSKIYNFHGIGLVSAGATASFTIQEPVGIGSPTAILSQTKG